MTVEFWLRLWRLVPWVVAALWWWRVAEAWRGLPSIVNLLESAGAMESQPRLAAIVPARNEEKDIAACLRSLLAQDYGNLQVLAVDDRSSDGTGAAMDALAGERLQVLHLESLPAGWLGKSHAMHVAAGRALEQGAEYLLFTDGDVLFAPRALRLAMAAALELRADHLVLVPTTIIRRWDEAMLLGFFQMFGLWAARPWRVADRRSRDAIGIGAFNLVRAEAYRQLGGFAAFPMAVVEDLTLGRRIKAAGLRQRVVFGKGLVSLHWAAGVPGLVRTMTKNIFAAANYRVAVLLGGMLWLWWFVVLPYAHVFSPRAWLPGLATVIALWCGYKLLGRTSGLSAWNALLAPLAALVFLFALLRSMVVTLWQGGVVWRGTFYPLAELRRQTDPLGMRYRGP